MRALLSIVDRLNQPFPTQEGNADRIKSAFVIAVFVGAFLFIVQPGDINQLDPFARFWLCCGFAGVSFSASLLYELFVHRVLKIRSDLPTWTLGKWILFCIGLISCIAAANLTFTNVWFGTSFWSLNAYANMLFNTWLVGIFPVVFSGLIIQLRAQKRHADAAQALLNQLAQKQNDAAPALASASASTSIATPDGSAVELNTATFRFAEAMQNYVLLVALDHKGDPSQTILRATMQSLEDQLNETPHRRCHRSFIVNLNAVISVTGNAQGLQLELKGMPERPIPVSRAYVSNIRNQLNAR